MLEVFSILFVFYRSSRVPRFSGNLEPQGTPEEPDNNKKEGEKIVSGKFCDYLKQIFAIIHGLALENGVTLSAFVRSSEHETCKLLTY